MTDVPTTAYCRAGGCWAVLLGSTGCSPRGSEWGVSAVGFCCKIWHFWLLAQLSLSSFAEAGLEVVQGWLCGMHFP